MTHTDTQTIYDRCCYDCYVSLDNAGVVVSKRKDRTPVMQDEICHSCSGFLVEDEVYRVGVAL